jgi:hypothetical protein
MEDETTTSHRGTLGMTVNKTGEEGLLLALAFSRATGANDTSLGTPIRMSPVNDTPPAAKDNAPVVVNKMAPVPTMDTQETKSKKRKSHANDTPQVRAFTIVVVLTDMDSGCHRN